MRLSSLYSRAGAPPATARAQQQHSAAASKTISLKTLIVLSTALCSLIPTAVMAQTAPTLTFSFFDGSGAQIGESFPVPKGKCTPLVLDSVASTNYTTIKSDDDHSALNLYKQMSCDFVERSAVGYWSNADPVSDIIAVRWEGTAPADRLPGSIGETSFPKDMTNQTLNPVEDDGSAKKSDTFVMDPAKGRAVVGIIAGILVIGVAIGIYQVYVAAQYKPPPKKPKKPKTGLNIKKIKKKDAYYKKPAHTEDQATFQRLQTESPEPYTGAGGRQPALSMTERSRDSQFSEAATFVDWNNQSHQRTSPLNSSRLNGKGYQDGSDSVSIDMRDTPGSNNNNNNRSPFVNSYSPDLMQFDNSGGRGYGQQQNQNPSFRGRGGEVLVPMDTLDHHHNNNNNNNNPYNTNNNSRAGAVRRSSSSRSR
ncbi:hypothetical protein BGW39_002206 [Mortierella sp. 14UC]|nr:hypothetical protein BGW39_002206 [Mortierella sp. 14UC]